MTPTGGGKRKENEMESIIVSRHPATIEFIKQTIGEDLPVVEQATAVDVEGRVVYGNLPLHLAALCHFVVAVEFAGTPPRGREYTLEDMVQAGARLAKYTVEKGGWR